MIEDESYFPKNGFLFNENAKRWFKISLKKLVFPKKKQKKTKKVGYATMNISGDSAYYFCIYIYNIYKKKKV